MTIDQMIKRVEKFKRYYESSISKSIQENRQTVVTLQRDQLLSGQDNEGQPLRPTYSADPFFKREEKRKWYMQAKNKKAAKHRAMLRYRLFKEKDIDTPNLIFADSLSASKFHRNLRASVARKTLRVESNWVKGKNVERKYPKALGLNPTSVKFMWGRYIREDLVNYWNNMR